jgi:hypothetical protein
VTEPFVGPAVGPDIEPAPYCTNWTAYGLSDIWKMVEREDGTASRGQAQAWRVMEQLCAYQARCLRRAADSLAEVWPPTRSRASQAYLDVVLMLATSLDESATAASATSKALDQLTNDLEIARQRISTLIGSWHAQQAQHAANMRATPPWFRFDTGLLDHEREKLDQAAQGVMVATEQSIRDARAGMQLPSPYNGVGRSGEKTVGPTEGTGRGPNVPNGTSNLEVAHTAHGGGGWVGLAGSHVVLPNGAASQPSEAPPVLSGGSTPPVVPDSSHPPTPRPNDVPPSWLSAQEHPDVLYSPARPGAVDRVPTQSVNAVNGPNAAAGSALNESKSLGGRSTPPAFVSPAMHRDTRRAGAGPAGRFARRRYGPADWENPWHIPKAVPGMLEPPTGGHDDDPGPNVIGLDR